MTLSYEQCLGLKGAGFPQDEQCDRFWVVDEPLYTKGEDTPDLHGGSQDRREWISSAECPNSDEIIAAIQARWPVGYFYAIRQHAARAEWSAEFRGRVGTGPTPAEALAALWLALATPDPA